MFCTVSVNLTVSPGRAVADDGVTLIENVRDAICTGVPVATGVAAGMGGGPGSPGGGAAPFARKA